MEKIIDTFSNRLAKALQIRNMKAIELSEKTGIDKSKISSYINGRYKAKQDALYDIANVLNVSPVWLMGYDVPMEETQLDTPEIRAIARGVANLTPENKELFKNLLKQMSSKADEESNK